MGVAMSKVPAMVQTAATIIEFITRRMRPSEVSVRSDQPAGTFF
jgi:hypothetical protein